MRQNKKNIKIHSLDRKKNKLIDMPENCEKMVKKHKKRIADVKFKTVVIPNDLSHTQFIVPVGRDENEVIKKYKDSRKY